MKDRTIMFLGMMFIGLCVVGMFGYLVFFKPSEELSPADLAKQCGTGTELKLVAGEYKCVKIEVPTEGPTPVSPGVCQIEDTTLGVRFKTTRTVGDATQYNNTTYSAFQFGDEIPGVITVGLPGATVAKFDTSITTLTPGYPIDIIFGDDDDTAPDYWYGWKKDIPVACQSQKNVDLEGYAETRGSGAKIEYFDGGTYESTANETLTIGQTDTGSYFRVYANDTDRALGNPNIPNPIGFCFAYNNTMFSQVRISDGAEFPVPSGLGGTADECWQWEHTFLFDGANADVDIQFVVKSTAGTIAFANDNVDAYVMTKNYFRNGNGDWVVGWEDDNDNLLGVSDTTADLSIDVG